MQKKLIIRKDFNIEAENSPQCYSFLNFASLSSFFENEYSEDIHYFCDGILMAKLVGFLTKKHVKRISFDFTSIAMPVLESIEKKNKKLYIIGAKHDEVKIFCQKIKIKHPSIQLVGYRCGFFNQDEVSGVANDIVSCAPDYVLIGLGAGKQEKFGCFLRNLNPSISVFTCGGFIRQESYTSCNYYPKFVNDFNLRAFYRMYKEPHTIKRYMLNYPQNVFIFLYCIIAGKVKIVLEK